MSNEAPNNLTNDDLGNGGDSEAIANSFESLKLSETAASGPKPCIPTPSTTAELGEHARDSGYGSTTSTPHPKDTINRLRKPPQIPLLQKKGLHISNKPMEAVTKRRFNIVCLEIEKMLCKRLREVKSVPGKYPRISIRPMMLGTADVDADAKPYMVVFCSKYVENEIQGFFHQSHVKCMCEPDDDGITSFKTLVIGDAPRLRASTADITVQCGAMNSLYDGTKTFCGTPIRLCDDNGHSRNATFGGMVRVTFDNGDYELYGLTAGHMIRDHQVVIDEQDTDLADLNGGDMVDLCPNEKVGGTSKNLTRTTSPGSSTELSRDDPDEGCFCSEHHLGKVLDVGNFPVAGEQSWTQPYLDWALFELNAHRPNQLVVHGREHYKGDLHLPWTTSYPGTDEFPVAMLCASQGVKRGVLSTTRARVLLGPGDAFTDAYTLSLQGSEVSDGDSGSWVVDELRLGVYGHVVADDAFGDAYVIPMDDILADIRRCFGAVLVDLPTGVDIILKALLWESDSIAVPEHKDGLKNQLESEGSENVCCLSSPGDGVSPSLEPVPADSGYISRRCSPASSGTARSRRHARRVGQPPVSSVASKPQLEFLEFGPDLSEFNELEW